jgi:hypothetical protein
MFMLQVLHQVMPANAPTPQIVPLSSGGLQAEWHTRGIDLEWTLFAPLKSSMWFEDARSGDTDEAELSSDFSKLRNALTVLALR